VSCRPRPGLPLSIALLLVAGCMTPLLAQAPPPPPPPPPPADAGAKPPEPPPPAWSGSLGAGLAVTSGNTDTSTLNVSFDLASRPKMRHVFKAEALYLRGSEDARLQLKLEIVDLYKTKPLAATIEKNDVSVVTAIAYKC